LALVGSKANFVATTFSTLVAIVDMFSYRNRIPKLKRFPRIGRNMNAYLRRMHRQKKKTPPLPQAPIKLIIAHKNDNKHKGKCNLFCRLGFEIAKTCKPSST
jgi:hypothetical protein